VSEHSETSNRTMTDDIASLGIDLLRSRIVGVLGIREAACPSLAKKQCRPPVSRLLTATCRLKFWPAGTVPKFSLGQSNLSNTHRTGELGRGLSVGRRNLL
jgi:hypothetical protein